MSLDATETMEPHLNFLEKNYLKDKILVTGSSGFLGSRLVAALEQTEGVKVRKFSRREGDNLHNLIHLERAAKDVSGGVIYHLAGKVSFNHRDCEEVMRTVAVGTQNLLTCAERHNIRKVVIVSSACTCGYSNSPYFQKTESSFERRGLNCYVDAKIEQEELARNSKVPCVIVSPTTCSLPISGTLVPCGGTNVVDPNDVVAGIISAMRHGRPKAKYLLSGWDVTYKELYDMVGKPCVVIPRAFKGPLKAASRLSDKWYISPYTVEAAFKYKYFKNNKAREALGWKPKITLEEMVSKWKNEKKTSLY